MHARPAARSAPETCPWSDARSVDLLTPASILGTRFCGVARQCVVCLRKAVEHRRSERLPCRSRSPTTEQSTTDHARSLESARNARSIGWRRGLITRSHTGCQAVWRDGFRFGPGLRCKTRLRSRDLASQAIAELLQFGRRQAQQAAGHHQLLNLLGALEDVEDLASRAPTSPAASASE